MRTIFQLGIARDFWMGQYGSVQAKDWDTATNQWQQVLAWINAAGANQQDLLGSEDYGAFQNALSEIQGIYNSPDMANLNTKIYGAEPLTDAETQEAQTFQNDAALLYQLIQAHPIPGGNPQAPLARETGPVGINTPGSEPAPAYTSQTGPSITPTGAPVAQTPSQGPGAQPGAPSPGKGQPGAPTNAPSMLVPILVIAGLGVGAAVFFLTQPK